MRREGFVRGGARLRSRGFLAQEGYPLPSMRPIPSILLALLLQAPMSAQHDEASCCAEERPVLAPLPSDATEKERWLRRIHDEAPADASNIFLSVRYLEPWRERLAKLPKDAPFVEQFSLRWSLSLALVRLGELDEAIALCTECLRLCEQHPEQSKSWMPEVLFRLAAAHFRLAERNNCIARHNAESCIFPLAGGAVHVDRRGAEAARELLVQLLALPDSDLKLEATWLLNLAHMALGSWPDAVPEPHRLPASALAPEADAPRWRERARELGLSAHTRAGSVVIDDFTGDGKLDVMTCSMDLDRSLRLCRNDGGAFVDVTIEAGLERQLGGGAIVQGDVDGDGMLDVLVLRGGGMFAPCEHPCSLLRQASPGRFVDVTKDAGIEIAGPTRSAAFADIDLDGDLDLFVGYETEKAQAGLRHPSRMWRNDGKGRFVDATAESHIANEHRVVGCAFGDVDGDGDADLYVSNWLAKNRLYINEGGGVFREEAAVRGVDGPEASGPCGFLDYDNDGDLDLFVAYQHHDRQIRTVAAFYLEGRVEMEASRLYENDGQGRFVDVAEKRGMRRPLMATGCNFGDVDADGRLDAYVATGAHDLAALFPNALLLGGERFRDATFAAGVGHLQKGNGVAFGDLDDDGDLDLVCQTGGFFQDDGFADVAFENPGHAHRWLAVDLVGVRDNRFGVGARIHAKVVDADGKERDVYATIGPGASLGCNPMRAFLGLGDAASVRWLDVRWPSDIKAQRVEAPSMDGRIRVTQDGGAEGVAPSGKSPESKR